MWIGILVQTIHSLPLKLSKPKAITSSNEFLNKNSELTTTTTYLPTDNSEFAEISDESDMNDNGKEEENVQYVYPTKLLQVPMKDYYEFYAQQLPTSEISSYSKEYNQNNDKTTSNLDKKSEFLQNEQPPPESNEPNYYIEKPIKTLKKYSSKIKSVNIKPSSDKIIEKESKKVADDDYSYVFGDGYDILEKYYVPDMSQSELTFPVVNEGVSTSDLNTGEVNTNPQRRSDNLKNQRVEFQMHGFKGPKSYKFGYDTGKG